MMHSEALVFPTLNLEVNRRDESELRFLESFVSYLDNMKGRGTLVNWP
jgi:hypothetical protein